MCSHLGRKYFRVEISEIGENSNGPPAYIELWASDMKEALEAAAGFIPSGSQPIKLPPGTSIGYRVRGARIVDSKDGANPTAVGEGLPKVTDCDDQGRCWLASDNMDVTMGQDGFWRTLKNAQTGATGCRIGPSLTLRVTRLPPTP